MACLVSQWGGRELRQWAYWGWECSIGHLLSAPCCWDVAWVSFLDPLGVVIGVHYHGGLLVSGSASLWCRRLTPSAMAQVLRL